MYGILSGTSTGFSPKIKKICQHVNGGYRLRYYKTKRNFLWGMGNRQWWVRDESFTDFGDWWKTET